MNVLRLLGWVSWDYLLNLSALRIIGLAIWMRWRWLWPYSVYTALITIVLSSETFFSTVCQLVKVLSCTSGAAG